MKGTDVDVNILFRFLGHKRDQYIAANLQKEAKDCDLMIAKVQHIMLDPRIEP